MTYAEKLRDPRWQKKRLLILERDGWKCCSCGSTNRNLQVHHLFYAKREPWDYEDIAYQTLCEDCHEKRGKIADCIANSMRIYLKDVPTDQMVGFYRRMVRNSQHLDQFRDHLIGTMHKALDRAEQSDARIHFGLLTDLMMDLFHTNLEPTPERARNVEKLLAMVEEKLSGIQ